MGGNPKLRLVLLSVERATPCVLYSPDRRIHPVVVAWSRIPAYLSASRSIFLSFPPLQLFSSMLGVFDIISKIYGTATITCKI